MVSTEEDVASTEAEVIGRVARGVDRLETEGSDVEGRSVEQPDLRLEVRTPLVTDRRHS